MPEYPHYFSVELRDMAGYLKKYLSPWISELSWEWNRIGGCGRATMKIVGNYKRLEIEVDDDVQIRIKTPSGSKLCYRGFVVNAVPHLSHKEEIRFECQGYFDKLSRFVVHDSNSEKEYQNTEVSLIVDDIINTFVVPNTNITKGTIDASGYIPDSLKFKVSVKDVLKTCFELLGNTEYGVDENLVFFWRTEDQEIRRKWFLGANVTTLETRLDASGIVNSILFEGGAVGGAPFKTSLSSQESINHYGKREEVIVNSSITTSGVASQYLGAILKRRAIPKRVTRARIENVKTRLEDSVPLGAISIIEPEEGRIIPIYGSIAQGGTGTVYGSKGQGGSGHYYGGIYRAQIDRIAYTLSDEPLKFNIELTLGGGIYRQTEHEKRIELELQNLRQRTA